ncbi:interferon lambda receptor 1 [Ambystoma mexicanum]|uniref:interferon lambda receptor 1 n=1 Tax=Ambystoma mexicanum TaxID=8296 RepID=UPI0037E831B6
MAVRARCAACALLYLLQHVAGQLQEPPRNVTFHTKNFTVFIKWLPGLGYPEGVRYSVNCRQYPRGEEWIPVERCQNITKRDCNITCCFENDTYSKYRVRVCARVGAHESPWKESDSHFTYIHDVELGPPQLQINSSSTHVTIRAHVLQPSCIPHKTFLDLQYKLECWENGKERRTPSTQFINQLVNQSTRGLRGNYCIKAQTIFSSLQKQSPFSEPVCTQLNMEESDWSVPLATSVGVIVTFVAAACLFIHFKISGGAKTPACLEFPQAEWPMEKCILDPQDFFVITSHLRTSDQHFQEVKDGYYSSTGSIGETISSCGGYTETHQFHQREAPGKDAEKQQTFQYKQLPSTQSTESKSSDSTEGLESSDLQFGNDQMEEALYSPHNKNTSSHARCVQRDVTPEDLGIEAGNSGTDHRLQNNVTYHGRTSLSPPMVCAFASSVPDLTLMHKEEPWSNLQCIATTRSQQGPCLPLRTFYDTPDAELNEEPDSCVPMTICTENSSLSDCSETEDWDVLISKMMDPDQPEGFRSSSLESLTPENSPYDRTQNQNCQGEKVQSDYMSR